MAKKRIGVKYSWKPGTRSKVKADTVGAVLENLRRSHGGRLKPEQIVEAARPDESPLHGLFEWDDSVAAEQWRNEQARHIIKAVLVTYSSPQTNPTRAFVSVTWSDEDGTDTKVYTSTHDAMSDPTMRAQVVQAALDELQNWRKKHRDLQELASLFTAIDGFGKAA